MLQNVYLLAKIGADTAENEQHFAKNLPKTSIYPTGPPGRRRMERRPARPERLGGRVSAAGDHPAARAAAHWKKNPVTCTLLSSLEPKWLFLDAHDESI